MVIALAGRRIDAPGAETRRFPLENVELVRRRLRELLARCEPNAVISSAACGADLIALQEAGAIGIRRRIILPFDYRRFRLTSVIDRPGDWGPVYDRVLDEVGSNGDLVTLAEDSDSTAAYVAANHAILAGAGALDASLRHDVSAVLVWEGASRGQDDLTEMFGNEAKARGFPIVEIRTLEK
jgi:hypothetical protein